MHIELLVYRGSTYWLIRRRNLEGHTVPVDQGESPLTTLVHKQGKLRLRL